MEFSIHVQLADILRRWCNPQWRWTHFPSGETRGDHRINPKTGKRYSLTGQRLQRMGTQKGWPDFQFFGPQRQTFFLELKRPRRGVVSDDQADVFGHLMACGHSLLITNSLDDAVVELKALGILRANIEVQ
jgi:hypothetical protein